MWRDVAAPRSLREVVTVYVVAVDGTTRKIDSSEGDYVT
jgi:hypothetical protein